MTSSLVQVQGSAGLDWQRGRRLTGLKLMLSNQVCAELVSLLVAPPNVWV